MTTGEPASGGPSLANVDAIFFLGHRDVPLDAQQKAELAAFVRRRQGLRGVAHRADRVRFVAGVRRAARRPLRRSSVEYRERHDHQRGSVVSGDPALRRATFPLVDEFYQPKEFSRDKLRVLLRLDVSKMPPKPNMHRADGDFPLAWAKTYGKGRVFYSSLGHAAETWDNREVAQMYFEAIKWPLGLTDGDATPRPLPGPNRARAGASRCTRGSS